MKKPKRVEEMAAVKRKKKKHCSNKAEVLQMVARKHQEKKKQGNVLQHQLKTVNQIRPIIEEVKRKMKEGGKKGNQSD